MKIERHKIRNIIFTLLVMIIAQFLVFCNNEGSVDPVAGVYHSPSYLEDALFKINNQYPDITLIEPIGSSSEGRDIWAFIISDNPAENEPEPRVRFTGSIHGDENVTTEVLLKLIKHLVGNYNFNEEIHNLINNRYIVFIPMLNPDGVAYGNRLNANWVDLNRNFSVEWTAGDSHGGTPFSESESISLREYSKENIFHLSATFHSGAVVVNMPFDYVAETGENPFIPEENSLVEYLAKEYSTTGRFLESDDVLNDEYVDEGTINGGDWYIIFGSLQDWSYLGRNIDNDIDYGCIDLTIEISDNRRPVSEEELEIIYQYNEESMLAYIDVAGIGVSGIVKTVNDEPLQDVQIIIEGGDIITKTDVDGYYHRILRPGNYKITFNKDGYEYIERDIIITDEGSSIEFNINLELL